MDRNSFRAALAQAGYTQSDLAKALNMAESTMVRKIKNNSFSIDQAEEIGKILGLSITRLGEIFFDHKVT